MNTRSVLDKYIQQDNTFNIKEFYNRALHGENDKLGLKPISNEYINITGQNLSIEDDVPRFKLEKAEHSTWVTLSSIRYIQKPTWALLPGSFPLADTKLENNIDLKIELEQILGNLNCDIEENNIVIRRELARWFEKNGERGINVVWDLPGEILSSEDKMPELLIALGIANDYNTIDERLEIFKYYSSKKSSDIRYGVLLGLSNLASYKILPIINNMQSSEKFPVFKQIIDSILSKFSYVK